jgi:hypothetical protein
MKDSVYLISAFVAIPVLLNSTLAIAQDSSPDIPGYVTQSVIDSDVLSHVRGRFAIIW